METVVLNLETVNLTDEQFYHLCQANQTWNLERNQKGELLGWLINPQQQQVEIYRLNDGVEIINLPAILSGEDVLPGFVLHLT